MWQDLSQGQLGIRRSCRNRDQTLASVCSCVVAPAPDQPARSLRDPPLPFAASAAILERPLSQLDLSCVAHVTDR